jgi:hypothetical protein
MKWFGGWFAHLGVAGMLVAGVAFSQAQSTAHPTIQSTTHLDKHARKIHHRLARYQNGRYLHLVMNDSSNAYGAIGMLSDASFTFTNADSNSLSTYSYDDVNRVKTDKEPIGQGTEPRHRIRHLLPIVAGVAALGAGAAVYQAER